MVDKINKIIRALVIIMLLTSIMLSTINHAKNNKLRDIQIAHVEELRLTGEKLKELTIRKEVAVEQLEQKVILLDELIEENKGVNNIE